MTPSSLATQARTTLTRERVVAAALDFLDSHGVEALSMHKLGASLDVKAMSLYNYVTSKEDLLNAVVESLWAEVEEAAPAAADWRATLIAYTGAIRATVKRHPKAAALIFSQQVMPDAALRTIRTHVTVLMSDGFSRDHAYDVMRTFASYVLGSALAEVTWDLGSDGCTPEVSDLLRPDTPEELAGVAQIFCGQSNFDAQFQLGLDLMLAGLEHRL